MGHIHPISSIAESFLRHFKCEKFHPPFDYDKWKCSTHRYISYKYYFPTPLILIPPFIFNSLSLSLSLFSLIPSASSSLSHQSNSPRYHLIAKARNYHGFDYELMSSVKIISATPKGEVEFELVSDEKYGNVNRVMHGGAAALIFDMCTTSALGPLARPGYWE